MEFVAYQLELAPGEELIAAVPDVIAVNMAKFHGEVIAACKLLARDGTDHDNVDVVACTKYGILFAYQADCCASEVSELSSVRNEHCRRAHPLVVSSKVAGLRRGPGLPPTRLGHCPPCR